MNRRLHISFDDPGTEQGRRNKKNGCPWSGKQVPSVQNELEGRSDGRDEGHVRWDRLIGLFLFWPLMFSETLNDRVHIRKNKCGMDKPIVSATCGNDGRFVLNKCVAGTMTRTGR